jgi:hypothetical protein
MFITKTSCELKLPQHLVIVGAGVLGLSVAEHYSRIFPKSQVTIIFCEKTLPASAAAAANLQTKGQRYGRDPHFSLKIEGKQKISDWIKSLIVEVSGFDPSSQNVTELHTKIFQQGFSRESFESKEELSSHLVRILQPNEEILNRKLAPQPIVKESNTSVLIDEEQWVCANGLLLLLQQVLKKRKVSFVNENIKNWDCLKNTDPTHLVLAPGFEILNLWKNLNLPEKNLIQNYRLTYGSILKKNDTKTFVEEVLETQEKKPLFWEHTLSQKNNTDKNVFDKNKKFKVTMTFPHEFRNFFCSSFTFKLKNLNEVNALNSSSKVLDAQVLELWKSEQKFLNFAAMHPCFKNDTFSEHIKLSMQKQHGIRIGFGHSELLVKTWKISELQTFSEFQFMNVPKTLDRISVVTGAHKSGFLFAPVIGEKLMSLIL